MSPTQILARIFTLVAALSMSGCYVLQAARGQLAISMRREPIEQAIDNPATPVGVQRRLRLVADARRFASRELGLPDNDTYRTYVDLHREFVVWNVFATDRYSVEPHRWCFPIAGCVVYRGYFKKSAAQRYALHTRMRGDDATVAGSAAYSTLGHFDDPVLSTMLRWSDAQIAATLFHELAHQVLYVPNESAFDEAFAMVVEAEGTRRWLEHRDPAALAKWRLARLRSEAFTDLLLAERERLRALYAQGTPGMTLYLAKQREFGRLKYDYELLKRRWGGYSGYDTWFDRALNNADLVSAATYRSCVPGLESLLHSVGDDLPSFYDAAKKLDADGRQKVCDDSAE